MNTERLRVDRNRIEEVVSKVLTAKEQRQFIFAEDITPPEQPFVDLMIKTGNEMGKDSFAVNALFLTTTFCFGDRTKNFFRRITNKERLNEYSWFFIPEEVVKQEPKYVEGLCHKLFGPLSYNGNATSGWFYNCKILVEKYDGDVRNFFKEHEDDAQKIVKALYVRNRAKTSEKIGKFRRFGPKLAHLAVQWTTQYKLYELNNLENAGLPVDFQLGRIMIQTEGIRLHSPVNTDAVVYRTLLPLLTEICREKGWDSRKVSDALWTLGSNCCGYGKHNQCPVEDLCTSRISSKPYQDKGLFDPTDNGRYR
jgi:hypothetical protein